MNIAKAKVPHLDPSKSQNKKVVQTVHFKFVPRPEEYRTKLKRPSSNIGEVREVLGKRLILSPHDEKRGARVLVKHGADARVQALVRPV